MKKPTKKQERALRAVEVLRERYPDATCTLEYRSAFELLVAVRLSAQCTDKRVDMVTPALFARYPDAAALAAADVAEVEERIRSCGLYKTKARDLVAMAQTLLERHGGEVPGTIEELTALPGVGRKTANLVCGDVFGMPGVVVADTHCIRIAGRLGLCDSKDPKKVETQLRALLPPEESGVFCHRLVRFGRDTCIARSPRCGDCPLSDICPSRQR
ncbi:MAG: endonuclease III [Clostridia bacterium]|nr:endonuclease III [Clostridia bacterium]